MPVAVKQSPKVATNNKAAAGIANRIKPLGEGMDDGLKVLLYGQSGTGKTTFWATFPGPILAVLCSGANKSGELLSINTPEHRKKVSHVPLYSSAEILDVVALLKAGEYQTLVLDHVSGLSDLVLKEILGLDELPPQLSWGIATQQQYGQLGIKLKELLRALLGLSCNVVIVGQEREFNTDTESDLLMPYVGVALTPSVVGWLNPACDYIVNTFKRQKTQEVKATIAGKVVTTMQKVKGVEYCLRTGPDPIWQTKFRVPKGTPLPDVIVDPSYERISKIIKGGS